MSDLDKLVAEQNRDTGSLRWCKKYPGSAFERIATLEACVKELQSEVENLALSLKSTLEAKQEAIRIIEELSSAADQGYALNIHNIQGGPEFLEKHKQDASTSG